MKSNSKAQAWGMDIIIAIMIFSVGIIIFLIYTFNQSAESKEKLEELSYDGENIFKDILSEGYPNNWDTENVIRIGIMSNNHINETKLEQFYTLSENNYSKTRSLFNTNFHYFFYLEGLEIGSESINGIGKPGESFGTITNNAVNLIKITRFTIYREKPVTVYLYIWEEE